MLGRRHKINVFFKSYGIPMADTQTWSVVVPSPLSRNDMLVGLHEVGHLVHPLGHPKYNDDLVLRGCVTTRILLAELGAWQWALSNFGHKLEQTDKDYVHDIMYGYYQGVQHEPSWFQNWYMKRWIKCWGIDFTVRRVVSASVQYIRRSPSIGRQAASPSLLGSESKDRFDRDWEVEYQKYMEGKGEQEELFDEICQGEHLGNQQ